jgi:hypothetical protein
MLVSDPGPDAVLSAAGLHEVIIANATKTQRAAIVDFFRINVCLILD